MKGQAPATATTVEEHLPKKAKVIDTAHLNEEDLKALKEQDPFLYYSIIQSNRGVDVMSSLRGGIIPRSASWCPSAREIEFTSTTKVKRRSCISFECHVDMFLDDDCTLEGRDDDDDDVDSDAMFDILLLQIRNEKKQ
jgi:hypothetical protein